tara:strand:+ start:88 stop:432 length:345 start_codon:yes stop_codon:yes gene_type:complete
MSRNYKPLPPIWRLNELFMLSNCCPNGLVWRVNKAKNKPGDPVGKLNKSTGYYMVSVDNEVYMVHRIVYYLRMGIAPDAHSVQHLGETKDNRTPLIETYKTPSNKKIMASGFKL